MNREAQFWMRAGLAAALVYVVIRAIPSLVDAPDPNAVRSLFVAAAQPFCQPEPAEQAQYVAGVLTTFLLSLARRPRLDAPWALALAPQLALAFVFVTAHLFHSAGPYAYYSVRAIVVACVLGAALTLAPLPTTRHGWPVLAIPVAYCVFALTPAIMSERSLAGAARAVQIHLPFTVGELAAPLQGKTPLVDFHPQYQNLVPLLLAPLFRIVPLNVLTFTATMTALSLLSMLAVLGVLLFVTRRPIVAAVLFLGFCAASFHGVATGEYAFNYFAYNPMRTFLPWCVALLLARYFFRPSRGWLVATITVATLAAINNLDLGVPSLIACGVTLFFCARGPWARVTILSCGGAVLAHIALVALVSGHFPSFAKVLLFQSMFAANGFYMFAMPTFGLHWVLFATYGLSLMYALFQREDRRREHAMLLFSSVLGFGAATYYVGRSHDVVLPTQFPFFALTNALLLFAMWSERRTVLSLIPRALVGATLILPIVALPWPRTSRTTSSAYPEGFDVIARELTESRGSTVIIAYPYADLLAARAGVHNAFPYAHSGSIALHAQVEEVAALARRRGITRLYGSFPPELVNALGLRVVRTIRPPNATLRAAGFEDFRVFER